MLQSIRNWFGTHPQIQESARRRAWREMESGNHDAAFQADPTLGEGFHSQQLTHWAHENPDEMKKRAAAHAKNYDYLYYPPEALERENWYSNGGNPVKEKTKITASPVMLNDQEKAAFWENQEHQGKKMLHSKENRRKNAKWGDSIMDRPNGDMRFVRKGQGAVEVDRHGKGIDPSAETVMRKETRLSMADDTLQFFFGGKYRPIRLSATEEKPPMAQLVDEPMEDPYPNKNDFPKHFYETEKRHDQEFYSKPENKGWSRPTSAEDLHEMMTGKKHEEGDFEKYLGIHGQKGWGRVDAEPFWDGKSNKAKIALESKHLDGSNVSRTLILHGDNLYAYTPLSISANKGQGQGWQRFHQAINHLSSKGFKSLHNYSARGGGQDPLIGYKVWPKFGMDGKIPEKLKYHIGRLPGTSRLVGAKTIQDLYKIPGGKEFWEEHGQGFDGKFDLTPNSPSMQLMNAYKERKEKQMKEKEEKPIQLSQIGSNEPRKIHPEHDNWLRDHENDQDLDELTKKHLGHHGKS